MRVLNPHRVDNQSFIKCISITRKGVDDIHLAQAINYLEAYHLEIGLLINFGEKSLRFKRLINSKFNQGNQKNQS
jgi:hypothetical protein